MALRYIVPSKSSIVSPVILVPKGNKDLRVCVDYRKLNSITKTDHYPLPLLQDIVSMITGCSVFSKIDLKDAFNQIPVVPADRNLTAFKCKFGIYEYKVMPFGLKNAPSTFQQMIDQVLNPILGTCCIAYLDDILVFLKDQVSHAHHLTQVFELLSAHNLKLKDSKCEFFKSKVTFFFGGDNI